MLTSLGRLYECGVAIDWVGFDQDYARRKVALPTYPFQRQRFWVEPAPQTLTPPLHDWWEQTDLTTLAARLSARTAYGDPTHLLPLLQALRSEQQTLLPAPSLDEQCYDLTWVAVPATPVPTIPPPTEGTPSHWLILADQAGLGATVAERLRAAGYATTVISAEALDHPIPLPEHPLAGILCLAALDAIQVPTALLADDLAVGSLMHEQERLCGSLLHLVQHLLTQRTSLTTRPRIWVATRAAQAVPDLAQTRAFAPLQAPLWGLGRVIALEAPEFWGGLIDLDPSTATKDDDLAALCSCLFAPDQEEQVAFRAGQRYAARLLRHQATPPTTPLVVDPAACYLITGGTGTLGLASAHWLAAQGARHLILTSRRGVTTATQLAAVDTVVAQGVRVQVLAIDSADPQAMAELQTLLAAQAAPLRGVIHAAGTSSVQPLATLAWATMAEVVRPKLLGGLLLHELVRSHPLDFFITSSSGAGIWGGKGQAHYAAANHALDGLAAWRRMQGLPALSIAWGPIADTGMLTAEEQGQ